MIAVGQKVKFDPLQHIKGFSSELHDKKLVTGTVVYVNYPHTWFSVEYNGQRFSFKFSEIGKDVNLSGHKTHN